MGIRSARRHFLRSGIALAVVGATAPLRRVRADAPLTATLAAMQLARSTEGRVSRQYFAFGRKAKDDGYAGIAYLFAAFATSERVHEGNFGKVLTALGAELAPLPPYAGPLASTRENLMTAANGETASIEDLYPAMLARIRPEGHPDAIRYVEYAWASERQHLDRIKQIRRWTPTMFEMVVRHIDAKTSLYFVCLGCGSTLNAAPASCPVCHAASTDYHRIDPPA